MKNKKNYKVYLDENNKLYEQWRDKNGEKHCRLKSKKQRLRNEIYSLRDTVVFYESLTIVQGETITELGNNIVILKKQIKKLKNKK